MPETPSEGQRHGSSAAPQKAERVEPEAAASRPDRPIGPTEATGPTVDHTEMPLVDVRLLPTEWPPESFKLLRPITILPSGM